jgi:rhodanese-related sulfurtransferase
LHPGAVLPTLITRDDLYERIVGPDPVTVVEALGAAYYDDAHLPGAINLPPGQVERLAPALLPVRDTQVVVYCSGTCSSAEDVAHRLEALGYTAVAVYPGGKEDWVEHGLPLERTNQAEV